MTSANSAKKSSKIRPAEAQTKDIRIIRPKFGGRQFLLVILLLVVFLAPYGRGLFWPVGRVSVALLVMTLALVALLMASKSLRLSIAQAAALGLVALYAFGLFSPASQYWALMGLITWGGYISIFMLWQAIQPSDKERELLGRTVVASAVVAAIVGILVYAEVMTMLHQLVGGRIATAFEYPNATASLFIAALAIAIHRAIFAAAPLERRVMSGAAVTLLTALILTLSRGAWLAFALFIPLILWLGRRVFLQVLYALGTIGVLGLLSSSILMAQKGVLPTLATLAIAALAALVASPPKAVYRAVYSLGVVIVMGAIALGGISLYRNQYELNTLRHGKGIVFSVAAPRAGEYTLRAKVTFSPGQAGSGVPGFAVWGTDDVGQRIDLSQVSIAESQALAHVFVVPSGLTRLVVEAHNHVVGTSMEVKAPYLQGESIIRLRNMPHLLLPYAFATRIEAFAPESLLADGRLTYFRDGLTLFVQSPLLGHGGGAWKALYPRIQSLHYGTRSIHSDPYEIVLEVGLLGMAFLLVLLYAALRPAAKGALSDASVALKLAAFLIFAHSFLEALLAFPAMYVVFFSLLGAAAQPVPKFELPPALGKALRWGGVAAIGVVIVLGAGVVLAELEARAAVGATQRGETALADAAYRRMSILSPWNTQILMDHAMLLWDDAPSAPRVQGLLERAQQLDPHEVRIVSLLGQFHRQRQDYEKSIAALSEAVRLQPRNEQNYALLLSASLEAWVFAGAEQDADLFLERAEQTAQAFIAMERESKEHPHGSTFPVRQSDGLRLSMALLEHLQGEESAEQEIANLMTSSPEEQLRILSAAWKVGILMQQGREGEISPIQDTFAAVEGFRQYAELIGAALKRVR